MSETSAATAREGRIGGGAAQVRTAGPPIPPSGRRTVLLVGAAGLLLLLALFAFACWLLWQGALSNETGRVTLSWIVSPTERLVLTWQETGGPPVTPPERQGFGSMMIRRVTERELGSEAVLDYRREGLVSTLQIDLAAPEDHTASG